jgi:hypothetical protein
MKERFMWRQWGRRWGVRAGCVAAALLLGGCAVQTGVEVRSVQQSAMDAPVMRTAAYTSSDRNTAEVYLTDLDRSQLQPGADLSGISGRIVQIRMFLEPLAGSTPIEASACSVIVRHIVLADGQVGIYGGGGFLNPDRRAGRSRFSGHVRGATLRLTAQTEGFNDALGAATLDARFSARRDEELAALIAARVDDLLLRAGAFSPSALEVGGR